MAQRKRVPREGLEKKTSSGRIRTNELDRISILNGSTEVEIKPGKQGSSKDFNSKKRNGETTSEGQGPREGCKRRDGSQEIQKEGRTGEKESAK